MNLRKATLEQLIELHQKGELLGAFEIPGEVYHAAPGLSKSGLDDVAECPAVYAYRRAHPEEPTDEMDFGNAVHTAILEPDKFADRYAVAGPDLNRRGTKAWDAFVEANPGKLILKHDAREKIQAMVNSARSHSRASMLEGLIEVSFFWKDPVTGIQCKCRPDILTTKGVIVDYKSAVEPWPARLWSSVVYRMRYHVQGAFYLDGVAQALLQSKTQLPAPYNLPDAFALYAQAKSEPFLVKPWLLGNASILLGRRTYQANLATVAECEKTGVWPGYPEALDTVECPEYAWKAEVEDETYEIE